MVSTNPAAVSAAAGTVAVNTATVQNKNVGLRLASLRRGGPELPPSGLAQDAATDPGGPAGTGPTLPALFASGASVGIGSRFGAFLNGQGSFGRQDTTSREPGFDFDTTGGTAGLDYRLTDQLIVGGAVGYLRTRSSVDAGNGDLTAHGASASAFGTYYVGDKFYVDGIATYGWNWYDTERRTPSGARARGDTSGPQLSLSGSGGANFPLGSLSLGPYGRLDYVWVEIDGYREHGAAAENVRVPTQDITSLTTALGGQASYAISFGWGVLLPSVNAEWQHEFEDDARVIRTTTADGISSVTRTNNPDRNYFLLGASLAATFRRGTSAFIHYEATLGREDFTNHGFTAGVRIEF